MSRSSIQVTVLGLVPLVQSLIVGCGPGVNCDVPAFERVAIILTPDTVTAGEQVTVVASFDTNAFGNTGFHVREVGAVIEDEPGAELIGYYSYSDYNRDMGEPPFVQGVILAGEVIDDRTFEMTVEFPSGSTATALPVQVRSDNGGVECNTGVLGEGTLEVTNGSRAVDNSAGAWHTVCRKRRSMTFRGCH